MEREEYDAIVRKAWHDLILQNRMRQLEKEIDKAIAEKDKIKDDLTCHAKLLHMNVAYPCRFEIGHKQGHSFESSPGSAYPYTVIDEGEPPHED